MLNFLPSPDDVIAVTVANKVTGEDLDAMMDRLEAKLAAHDKVHVFAEAESIEGLEVSGLGGRIGRATPLMGKLRRFGRVAVVADQAWVRAAARVESAVLPFVGYRVFEPEQRAEALEWVLKG
ncbi:MAG: STAS/SEC14 domain-containing protein [Luteimonas sp.]